MEKAILIVAVDVTQAKKAIELREDIDRMMRHDLRSPLNGIITMPQLLIDSNNLPPEDKELLQAISDSGSKMLNLIDSSSSLYRLESNTYDIDKSIFIIAHEFKKIEMELSNIAKNKNIRMLYKYNNIDKIDYKSSIRADTSLFPFLLSNLVKNAMEASPINAQVKVAISCKDGLEISIQNFGEVPEYIRPRFFEKYTTYGKSNGTGLGTYSARLIVQAHGGRISMESSPEQGTIVTFTLPQKNPGTLEDGL